ncbi:MAG: hypothetical protein E6J56_22540 [Deltaproteobacteria bacterium]|nr:MAG: hypothetical protein E6J56_22540 [Deltaproteobacteria bacterium]
MGSWTQDYGWLDNFWRDVITPGRRWVVATLYDADIFVRDALAHAVVRERLRREGVDVRYQFVRPFEPAATPPLEPDEQLLFIGRPKPFRGSSLGTAAHRLESYARGRFVDPGDVTVGHSVRYDQRLFSRHELESAPGQLRRSDLDYGLLLYRRERTGETERRLVALAGLSTLGTLGLALILTDDARRRELVRQARELLPWRAELHPEESAELCVRIHVPSEEHLANLLNAAEFAFRVEAVALAPGALGVQPQAEAEMVLVPDAQRQGGVLRLPGAAEVKLTRARFELLRMLVEEPSKATSSELCRRLGFASGSGKTALKRRSVRLAKLVHDLNASLRAVPGLQAGRLVRFRKKQRRYALTGARATVVRAARR